MGRINAELAMRYRPRTIIISDVRPERLEMAQKRFGSRARRLKIALVTSAAHELEVTVERTSAGGGADDIIFAVGDLKAQQAALALLAEGGVANFFSALPRGHHLLELDSTALHYDEVKLVGSTGGQPSDMAAAIQVMMDGQIDPGNYVYAVGSLDHVPQILNMIEQKEVNGKVVLYPHADLKTLRTVDYWDKAQEEALLEARLIV